MLPTPLFSGWEQTFRHYRPELGPLLDNANRLVEQSLGCGRVLPSVNLATKRSSLEAYLRLQNDSMAEPNILMTRTGYQRALQVLNKLERLAQDCMWPRWIDLEQALGYAIASGNLLVSCLLLRTLIEEVAKGEQLDRLLIRLSGVDRCSPLPPSESDVATARSLVHLLDYILPRIRARTSAELAQHDDKWNPLVECAPLQESYRALNDYVHPNYGSHIVAMLPHLSDVANVVLTALIGIYEIFESAIWVAQGRRTYEHIAMSSPMPRNDEIEVFREKTLPLAVQVFHEEARPCAESKAWISGLETMMRKLEQRESLNTVLSLIHI